MFNGTVSSMNEEIHNIILENKDLKDLVRKDFLRALEVNRRIEDRERMKFFLSEELQIRSFLND